LLQVVSRSKHSSSLRWESPSMTNLDVGSQPQESEGQSTNSLSQTLQTANTEETSSDTVSPNLDSSDGEQEPQGQEPSGPVTPLQYRVSRLSRSINRAVRQGDHEQATRLMDEQLNQVMQGMTVDEFNQRPGDPVLWTESMRDAALPVGMRAMAFQ